MNTSISRRYNGLSRLKLFWALSRTPHGIVDISMPALSALLWIGAFPSLKVILLGLLTAFAGYTAVYALNDVIDYRLDKERVRRGELPASDSYLEDVLIRHPMAYGLLSIQEGMLWVLAWGGIAIWGAYVLNPVCVLIFLAGCLLEVVYCSMLKISAFRTLVSGVVKTSGAIAAVFAVEPHPSFFFLMPLFIWVFCWEIGGQNIPHDWADIEEDRRLEAQTVPVRFGPERSATLIIMALMICVVVNVILLHFSQVWIGRLYVAAFFVFGLYHLVVPAVRLYKIKERSQAMALFNRASYYPLALLMLVVFKLIIDML